MHNRLRLSSAVLLSANLAPLAGVLFLGWSVSSVFSLFPDEQGYFADGSGIGTFATLARAIEIFSTPLAYAAAALALSHAVSFVVNYLGGREYEHLDIRKLMMLPYGRIVVLLLTIIFGGFAALAFGEPVWLIVILVVIKMAGDLRMHLREHLNAAGPSRSEIEEMPADEGDLTAGGRPAG